MEVTTAMRKEMYHRIRHSKFVSLEQSGFSRIIASITTDVERIVQGARILPDLLTNFVTIIGLLGFLVLLNEEVFFVAIKAIAFGVVTYQLPMFFGAKYFELGRQNIDRLHESIRGLVLGIKELKMNNQKASYYFDNVLLKDENNVLKAERAGHTIASAASNYGELISLFIIGMVAFVSINYITIDAETTIGAIMVLLYLSGPIAIVLNAIPDLVVARISSKKFSELMQELEQEYIGAPEAANDDWTQIVLSGVTYRHKSFLSGTAESFTVGPVSMAINRGDVSFIVGGNGSGKSTLGKLLCLLYKPDSGDILLGTQKITDANSNSYQQKICTVFSDFFLFKRLLSIDTDDSSEKAFRYLQKLQLDKKVSLTDGEFSTLSLSDGQKKRLALLACYLEDRDVYIFDEWAADQDPVFKEVFYREILTDLKAAGKTVVVISHDDRYFDVADQLIFMEDGKVLKS